jgi:hypothetical protein
MHTLTSGADYPALGLALLSACDALVNHGLVAADCVQVDQAIRTTMMILFDTAGAGQPAECGPGWTPQTPVIFDDFESRSGWTLTPGIWEYIPAPDVPVRYSYSGTTALYGFAGAGQVGYAELNAPFTVTNTSAYSSDVNLRMQALSFGSGQLQFEYNAGGGWLPLGSPIFATNDGYHAIGADIQSLFGQTIRIRLKLDGNSTSSEWLIDDVRVQSCLTINVPYEPHFFSGNIVGNTGTVSWQAWSRAGDRFEISYDPPVPGAPAIVNAVNDPFDGMQSYSITLPGIDPGRTYRLSIVQVYALASGRPIEFTLSATAPLNCPSTPPQFLTIWTPPRTPTTPSNVCDVVAPPRRSG